MKVVAHVGVKDEVEMIGSCIKHLESIGVDQVIVCDLGSSDGTLDVLEDMRSDGLDVVRADDLELGDLEAFKLRNVEIVQRTAADWVMFLDADERWLPATGRVKDCGSLQAYDLLSVRRFNAVLSIGEGAPPVFPEREQYGNVLLHVARMNDFRARFEAGTAPPWCRNVPAPKIMVRPSKIASLGTGGHSATAREGLRLRKTVPSDLLIMHLPFTTQHRFSRKVRNVARVLNVHDEHFGADMAWHWRKWSELATEPEIAEEFYRQGVAPGDIRALRSGGSVRSAAEMLHG